MVALFVRGQCIYTRFPMYPVNVTMEISHTADKPLTPDEVIVEVGLNSKYVHSDVLDENDEGELEYVGNDLKKITVIKDDEFIPTFLTQSFYFDFIPSSNTTLAFPLKGRPGFHLSDLDIVYSPLTGEINIYGEIECRTLTLRESLIADCLRNGWIYS